MSRNSAYSRSGQNYSPASRPVTRGLIHEWGKQNPHRLSLTETYNRVAGISNYLGMRLERRVPAREHETESKIGEYYFHSLEYSDKLQQDFSELAKTVATILYNKKRPYHYDQFRRMSEDQRAHIARYILRKVFHTARDIFTDKLRKPELRISHSYRGSDGWVEFNYHDLMEGRMPPVFLSRNHVVDASFEDFMNTIVHESTHHIMMQLTSLYLRDLIHPNQNQRRDFLSIAAMSAAEIDIPEKFFSLYRANPFERIAYRTGDAAEHFFRAYKTARSTTLSQSFIKRSDYLLDRTALFDLPKDHDALWAHLRRLRSREDTRPQASTKNFD